MQQHNPLIGAVRGAGFLVAAELVQDRDPQRPAPEQARRVHHRLRELGVIAGRGSAAGNVLRFNPALTMSSGQIEGLIDTVDEAFAAATK